MANSIQDNKPPVKKKRAWWFRLFRSLLVCYLLIMVLMVIFERFLVYPAPGRNAGNWNPTTPIDEIDFESQDGTKLVGWLLKHPEPKNHILYFHGNAENVALTLPTLVEISQQLNATVFAIDYRGYGKSQGKPHEMGLCDDGVASFKKFSELCSLNEGQICVFGRSLGGAVAVHVGSVCQPKALILQSTFDQMVSVAANKFPWLPVRWLMRNRFNSAERAVKVRCPVLQFHGTNDRIVPIKHGERLYRQFDVEKKKFIEVDHGGHNDSNSMSFYEQTKRFLDDI